jgi:hypothetical protein
MAKGEKVKTISKSSPPPSDELEMDSSDESSDEEVNQLVSEMDKQSRDFMTRLNSGTRENPRHSYIRKK